MACNKTEIIKDIEKRIARTLKAKNTGMSNDEIRAAAKADAPKMFKEMQEEQMGEEADAAELERPEIQKLNAARPHVKHTNGKTYVPVKVVGRDKDGKINYNYPKGEKTYSATTDKVKLYAGPYDTAASQLVSDMPAYNVNTSVASGSAKDAAGDRVVTISNEVEQARAAYVADPSKETADNLANYEALHGLRNSFGETIAEGSAPRVLKSAKDAGTTEEIEDFYFDEDGSMSKSENINGALKGWDKKKYGEQFDVEHSKELDETLAVIVDAVNSLNEADVTITEAQITRRAAMGEYSPFDNTIEIHVDSRHNGDFFRQRFTQTAQEVYVHELVHAATEFIFDGSRDVASDPVIAGMVTSVKELYNTARKGLTGYEGLLPGYTEGVTTYSDFEIQQAKDKYEYIFNNEKGVGLEEFMAHLLTNKQFKLAMSNINAISKVEREADAGIIDNIINAFRDFLGKLVGFTTHKKDASITEAGADLLFKMMKAHGDNAMRAASNHPAATAERAAEYLDTVLDGFDEALIGPADRIISELTYEDTIKGVQSREQLDAEVAEANESKDKDKLAAAIKKQAAKTKEVEKLFLDIAKLKDSTTKRAPGKSDTRLGSLKNSAISGGQLLRDLVYYARILRKLRKLRELEPDAYAQRMSFMNGFVQRMQKHAIAKILSDFSTKDLTYSTMTDAILKLTASVDTIREGNYEDVLAGTKEWFGRVEINSDALREQNVALSDTILRTDIQSLGVDAKGLLELLEDSDKVTAEVVRLRGVIKDSGMLEDALLAAEAMVSGGGLITNAHNIASGFGRTIKVADPVIVEALDKYISFKALELVDTEVKKTAAEFISGRDYVRSEEGLLSKTGKKLKLIRGQEVMTQEEYTEQVQSGVNDFLLHAEGTAVQSKLEMKEEPHNLIKGYMKETFDPGNEMIIVPAKDRVDLEKDGYVFVRMIREYREGSEPYAVFTRKDGKTSRANGALGLQGVKARGVSLSSMIHEEIENAPLGEKIDYFQETNKFKKELEVQLAEYNKGRLGASMQPVYDATGAITDFRVNMLHSEKRLLLDMETRGTQNLARTFGTFGTVAATLKHNKEVLVNIKEDADKYSEASPEEYVIIRPRASLAADDFGLEALQKDASEEEQLWARLPESTKVEAAKLYGGDKKIIIRRDLVLPAFGENDLSISDSKFSKYFGKAGQRNLKQIENYWQDLMQIAKGNIVIKVPAVLIGNVVSNAKILFYLGVNPVKGTRLLLLGARELKRYESERKELNELKRVEGLSRTARGNKVRIKELEASLEHNMVHPLIAAGMYQSIVEDVSTRRETNRVSEKANKVVDKYVTNKAANTAVQYLFLTEKTKPFQAMLKATQVSDFYFRFAQYYDAIDKLEAQAKAAIGGNKKAKVKLEGTLKDFIDESTPLRTARGNVSEEMMDAIKYYSMREITDNYINYEAPLHKSVRYWDKMNPGFVRYYTNIQRVIKKIAKAHPGRVVSDFALQLVIGDTDGIEDQTVMEKGLAPYMLKTVGMIKEAIIPPGPEVVMAYAR